MRVLIAIGGNGKQGISLAVHEIAADLIRAVGETGRMLICGRRKQDDRGVDGAGAQCSIYIKGSGGGLFVP